jgi:hypothetical protein
VVATFNPRYVVASPLENKDLLDEGAILDSGISDGLGCNGLATTPALVGSDEDARLAVEHAITQGLGGETGEDDGVDSANSGTGEEGGDGVPSHGEVDRDGVALLDTPRPEDVGDAADFAEQFGVGDLATLTRFVGFVDDGGLKGASVNCSRARREVRTLLGCLYAQRSTQLYEAFRPPSGNHTMSPFSNEPDRTVWKFLCQ